MLKSRELTDPASCMSRARDDEMTFVLLGRDAAAPRAIYAWCEERVRLGKNKPGDAQIVEALECALGIERAHGHAHLVRAATREQMDEWMQDARVEVTFNPWLPHPTAPGWMWNTVTNEVVSDAEYAAL